MLIQLLAQNPLLLLFVVAAVGFPLGRLRFKGCSLGVSAVLFVGLFFGALDPALQLPELLSTFGLTLFVYTVGLSTGPAFFGALNRRSFPGIVAFLCLLGLGGLLAALAARALGLGGGSAAGLFAGAMNNTPALATIVERLRETGIAELASQPVVAYSLTYPAGVLGSILTILLAQRLWKVDYEREPTDEDPHAEGTRLGSRTVRITRPGVIGRHPFDLRRENHWPVVFGRFVHRGRQELANERTVLAEGDQLIVIGPDALLDPIVEFLGESGTDDFAVDRTHYDWRRIFVSNRQVIGRRIRDLAFLRTHEVTITRVRRGDIEFLPSGEMVLEPGDRVRVVCRREMMDEVSAYFGDSYKAVSEIDILSFSLGLAMGILLGLVPVPVGEVVAKLGFAGGPLVVGLVLGRLYRSGSIVWVLPYGATLMLRQVGLLLFLSGVGTRAGYPFYQTLVHGNGLWILLAGMGITSVILLLSLWLGHRVFRMPFSRALGFAAGLQTQAAVLGFALEQTRNERPNTGYATMYPLATLAKIVLAQVILNSLGYG